MKGSPSAGFTLAFLQLDTVFGFVAGENTGVADGRGRTDASCNFCPPRPSPPPLPLPACQPVVVLICGLLHNDDSVISAACLPHNNLQRRLSRSAAMSTRLSLFWLAPLLAR